jgi:hypothetical protein
MAGPTWLVEPEKTWPSQTAHKSTNIEEKVEQVYLIVAMSSNEIIDFTVNKCYSK